MKQILLFLLVIGGIYPLQAQTYTSRKLSEIGEQLPKSCLPAKDSIFSCPQAIKVKNLVVHYNEKKEIAHLGVSLFSPEMKEIINLSVCNFIERLLLELTLQKSPAMVNKKLQEYGVSIEEQDLLGSSKMPVISTMLAQLQQPVQFSLQQSEVIYRAIWKLENNNTFCITFPASRELIFGTNKKESDQTLSELLPENRCGKIQENKISIQKSELERVRYSTNIFVRKGTPFTLPELNSDTYYTQNTEGDFVPVEDDNYPALFLKNLLLLPQLNTNLKLHIKHRMYGSFTPEFEIKPNDFACFFQPEFDMYCHIDDTRQDILKATVILYNRIFSYTHLLSVTVPVGALFQENGILQAEFYSNIPQHNVKTLFGN